MSYLRDNKGECGKFHDYFNSIKPNRIEFTFIQKGPTTSLTHILCGNGRQIPRLKRRLHLRTRMNKTVFEIHNKENVTIACADINIRYVSRRDKVELHAAKISNKTYSYASGVHKF